MLDAFQAVEQTIAVQIESVGSHTSICVACVVHREGTYEISSPFPVVGYERLDDRTERGDCLRAGKFEEEALDVRFGIHERKLF